MNDIEVWKLHPEFCSIEVSTLGNIRTLNRYVTDKRCGKRLLQGNILKQRPNNWGYLRVDIPVNGRNITRYVHRLVAQTYIPNPDNLPQVNHKDCDITNNSVLNLEWCDNSYNQRYKNMFGKSNTLTLGHPLFAIDLGTLKVLKFSSQSDAGHQLEVSQGNINGVLKGRYKQTHNYWFTNADKNAVESTRVKFGDSVARKVEELMTDKEFINISNN